MEENKTFADLGIVPSILESLEALKWKYPSKIQQKAIPHALQGKDIIGLAATGSGKTAAFAIPIIQTLLETPRHNYALVVTPTRELALQIQGQFQVLGEKLGLRTICLVGGQNLKEQAKSIKQKFHVIIGTPGRLMDHLENTKEFRRAISRIQYLVLDETDKLLTENYEASLLRILKEVPEDRRTHLYSATMTDEVEKLVCLCRDPMRIEADRKCQQQQNKLQQHFLFLPEQDLEVFLAALILGTSGEVSRHRSVMVFVGTWRDAERLSAMLKRLKVSAVPLYGKMPQSKRENAIDMFRKGEAKVIVATDLASRGLDIPTVDMVVNYNVPRDPKDYLHRVGRTARAGQPGRAVTMTTVYSVTRMKLIEKKVIGGRMTRWPLTKEDVAPLRKQVADAMRLAQEKLRDNEKAKKDLTKKRKLKKGKKNEDQ